MYGKFQVIESSLVIGFWVKCLKGIILWFNSLQALTYKETYTKSKVKLFSFHKILTFEGWNLPVTTHEGVSLLHLISLLKQVRCLDELNTELTA